MLHQVRQNAFPDHLLLWIFRQDRHKSYCSSQPGNYLYTMTMIMLVLMNMVKKKELWRHIPTMICGIKFGNIAKTRRVPLATCCGLTKRYWERLWFDISRKKRADLCVSLTITSLSMIETKQKLVHVTEYKSAPSTSKDFCLRLSKIRLL